MDWTWIIVWTIFGLACLFTVSVLLMVVNKKGSDVSTNASGARTPLPAPKKGHGWVWILSIVVVVGFLVWWLVGKLSSGKTSPASQTGSGISIVQPPEKWVAIWSLPVGEYDNGQNEVTIEARIVENDETKLWFDTVFEYNGATRVARHFLTRVGDRFDGTWYQDVPSDSGTLYLKRVAEYTWVGQETDRKGNRAPYTLIRQK